MKNPLTQPGIEPATFRFVSLLTVIYFVLFFVFFLLFIDLLIYYLSLFSVTCHRRGQRLVWLEVGLLIIIIVIIINFSSSNSSISGNSAEVSPSSVSLVELFSD